MFQWSNRFHVLSDEFSDACSALHQSESHGSVETMLKPFQHPSVHSKTIAHDLSSVPPAKIFIRSTSVRDYTATANHVS